MNISLRVDISAFEACLASLRLAMSDCLRKERGQKSLKFSFYHFPKQILLHRGVHEENEIVLCLLY